MSSNGDLHSPEVSVSGNLEDEDLVEQISRISLQNESYNSCASKEAALRLKKVSHSDSPADDTRIKLKATVLRRCECKLSRSKELMSIESQLLENLVTPNNSQHGTDPSLLAATNELSAKKQRLHHAIRTIFDIFQSPVKFKIKSTNEVLTFALIDIVSLDLFNKANSIIMSFIEIIENLVSDDNNVDPTNIHSILLKKESTSHSQIQKMNLHFEGKKTDSIEILPNNNFNKPENQEVFSGINSKTETHKDKVRKNIFQNASNGEDHMGKSLNIAKDSGRKQIETVTMPPVISSPMNRTAPKVPLLQKHTNNSGTNIITDNSLGIYKQSPINKLGKQSLFDSISSKADDLYVLEEYDDKVESSQNEVSQRNSLFLRLNHSPSYGLNNSIISSRGRNQSFHRSPATPTRNNRIRHANVNRSFDYITSDNQIAHHSPNEANIANREYPVFPGFANEYDDEQQIEEFIVSNSQRKIYSNDMDHSFTSRGGAERQRQAIIEYDVLEANNISKPPPRQLRNLKRIINTPSVHDSRIISPSREIHSMNNSNYDRLGSDRELLDEDAQIYNRRLFRELSNNGHVLDSHNNSVQYNQYHTSSPISHENFSNRRTSDRSNNNPQQQIQHYYIKGNDSDANISRQYNSSIASSPIQFQQQPSPNREAQISQYRGLARPLASPLNRESVLLESNQFIESQRMSARRVATANAYGGGNDETLKRNSSNNREGVDDMIIINGNKYMLYDQARNVRATESYKLNKWKRHSSAYLDNTNSNNFLLDDQAYKRSSSFIGTRDWFEDGNPAINSSNQSFRRPQKHSANKSNRNSYIV